MGRKKNKAGAVPETMPAFNTVPAAAAATAAAPASDNSDDEEANVITANNYDKKRSIAALSAKEVLAAAEVQRKREAALLGGSSDDNDDDDDDDGEAPLKINQAFATKFEDEKRKATLSKRGSRGDALSTLLREAVNNSSAMGDDSDDEDELLAEARAQLRAQTALARAAAADGPGRRPLANSESDESGSEEDEEGGLLTSELNAKISQTLAAIREKKPEVYDPKKSFFTEEEMAERKLKLKEARHAAKASKPQTVNQLLAEQLLSSSNAEAITGGSKKRKAGADASSDSDSDDDDGGAMNSRARLQSLADHPSNLTYSQQQQQLKDNFLQSVKATEKETKKSKKVKTEAAAVKVEGDKKKKSKVKQEEEEEESSEGSEESDEEVFRVKKRASDDGDDDPASSSSAAAAAAAAGAGAGPTGTGEDFLNSYLSQEWWREKDLTKLPTYRSMNGGEDLPEESLSASEDEALLDDQDTYEAAYNFRFQEPNNAFQIKSYPRNIEDSLRKEDSKRKIARETAKKTKEAEVVRKKEEIKRLKAEKRKEISKKLGELESITGLKEAGTKFDINDLLNNWDPSKHDEMMAKLFSEDEFYASADGAKDGEMDEDVLREMVLRGEDLEGMGYGKLPVEGASKKKKGKKGAKKLDEAASAAFDEASRAVQKGVHDLQQLDFEDLVGTVGGGLAPTRFRYKEVTPDSHGLTLQEILEKPDAELNSRVSLKKLATYREDKDEAEYSMPHKAKRDAKMAKYSSKAEQKQAWMKAHPSASAAAAANAGHKPSTPAPGHSQKKHHKPTPKPAAAAAAGATSGASPAAAAAAAPKPAQPKPAQFTPTPSHTPSNSTKKPQQQHQQQQQKPKPAGASASSSAAAATALTPSQKRRLRKKKLDEKPEGEQGASKKQKTSDE